MKRRFALALVVVVLGVLLPAANASSSVPLKAWFVPYGTSPYGVSTDGMGTYFDGVAGVSVQFNTNNTDAVLFTYNTTRTMHFVFNTSSSTYQAALADKNSTISETGDFYANVDFDGINFFGAYYNGHGKTMLPGTITRVHLYIQFYQGNVTYELDYPNAAVIRGNYGSGIWFLQDPGLWLITTNGEYAVGSLPTINATATLSQIRRRTNTIYPGTVDMPVQILFALPTVD